MPVDLFAPYRIGRLELRNRFVRSATWDGTADTSGAVTDDSVALYRELGRGGVGLIVTGFAFVSPLGQARHGQYGAHTNDMVPGLVRLVRAAQQGGAKIALQIHHGGIKGSYLHERGVAAQAVSEMSATGIPHREMTDEEIESVVADFAAAALRAREAGFDAVQLHGAHGYLMNQFLSPLFNLRTDRWGGSAENRRRFCLEVVRRVRRAVGADFPLMIKLGVQDEKARGLPLEEGLATARQMVEEGIAAIEVSAGADAAPRTKKEGDPEEVYFRERTSAVKRAVAVPVMAVGGIRSLETVADIVDSGDADLISMCRSFIREPGIVARWQTGARAPSNCITCGKCIGIAAKGQRLECWQERRLREEMPASGQAT